MHEMQFNPSTWMISPKYAIEQKNQIIETYTKYNSTYMKFKTRKTKQYIV